MCPLKGFKTTNKEMWIIMKIRRFLINLAKSYLVLGALSASAYAVADDSGFHPVNGGWNNCAPGCGPSYCPPPCPPPCAPACEPCCPQPQAPNCNWGYNPPGYFKCCENPCGSFIDSLRFEADFLYWRATSGSVGLGYTDSFSEFAFIPGSPSFTGPVADTVSFVDVKPKFEPAFRIGVSHACDCWDSGVYWTHFHSKETANAVSDFSAVPNTSANLPYTAFHPFWEAVANSIPDTAKGVYNIDMDYVDLDIGYKYYVCHSLKVRPHAAIRILRLDQSYKYTASASRTPPIATFVGTAIIDGGLGASANVFTSASKAKNDFLGAGPLAGFEIEFDVGCGLSLFGKAAGSIVFGRDHRSFSETYTDFDSNAVVVPGLGRVITFEESHPSYSTSGSISDLEIGLKWERCVNWCNGCHPVSFAISWEHHGFYDFSDFGFQGNGTTYVTTGDEGTTNENPVSNGSLHNSSTAGTIYTQGVTFAFNVGF